MEVHYNLMTFGIPTKLLPYTENGEIRLDNHQLWFQQRQNLEKSRESKRDEVENSQNAIFPGPLDILMGRDKVAREHVGNRRFLNIIQDNKEMYDAAPSKADKTLYATQMVHIIKESGGRFLRYGDIGWIEADEVMARDKISNAFRSIRKADVAKRNKNADKQVEKRRINSDGFQSTENGIHKLELQVDIVPSAPSDSEGNQPLSAEKTNVDEPNLQVLYNSIKAGYDFKRARCAN